MKTLVHIMVLVGCLIVLNGVVKCARPAHQPSKTATWKRLLSDWFWIQAYEAWLAKDEVRVLERYRFATALQPGNLTYWRLAAQTIAHDFPHWVTEGKRQANRRTFGEMALSFFEESRSFFEEDANWYLTAAFLAESSLNDQERALRYLEEAVAIPDFPFRAGYTYARLLLENGQPGKALAFLQNWLPKLKESGLEPRIEEVENWIRQLKPTAPVSVP